MFNNKFLATLIGLTIAIMAVWYSDFGNSDSVLENFVNVPRTVKPMATCKDTALQNGATLNKKMGFPSQNNLGSSPMFMIPGTFQNSLEPRANSYNNFGPRLQYKMPSIENQAVPPNPLTFGNMVKENFSTSRCSTQNVEMNSQSKTVPSPNSYQAVRDSVPVGSQVVSDLPVPDMATLNIDGTVDENPIVYNRMMYANQKSRLQSLGCYLRGDLPIAPVSGSRWFNVSVQPHIDLNSGAMSVMGGLNNDTANELYQLQHNSSGTYDSTLGGADIKDDLNISAQKTAYQDMATNDVHFTAFP